MTDRLTALLSGDGSAHAVLPRLEGLADVVCGEPWDAVADDASRLVPALKRLAGLFGSDGLLLPGEAPAAAEAARRLENDSVVVMLRGPVAAALEQGWDGDEYPEDLKSGFNARVEGLCGARIALLLLDESGVAGDLLVSMPARKIYNTIRNVAAYFDIPVGAVIPSDNAEIPAKLKLDVALLACTAAPDADVVERISEDVRAVGFALPANDAALAATVAAAAGRPCLFTTLAGSDGATIETMHGFMGALRGGA